jgi:hypothetical protein
MQQALWGTTVSASTVSDLNQKIYGKSEPLPESVGSKLSKPKPLNEESKQASKCGTHRTLPTFAQPRRRLRVNLEAKPKPGNSGYQWLRIRGQVNRMQNHTGCCAEVEEQVRG